MEKVELLRTPMPTQTIGSFWYKGERIAYTLELPWKENQHNISCIPLGEYDVIKEETSNGHAYPHFRVLNVPNRNGILFHRITYVKDLRGCIGIAGDYTDLNQDGVIDAIKSSVTLQHIYDILPDRFKLSIKMKAGS